MYAEQRLLNRFRDWVKVTAIVACFKISGKFFMNVIIFSVVLNEIVEMLSIFLSQKIMIKALDIKQDISFMDHQ